MNKQIYIPDDEMELVKKAQKEHGKDEKNGKIGIGSLLVKLIKKESKKAKR